MYETELGQRKAQQEEKRWKWLLGVCWGGGKLGLLSLSWAIFGVDTNPVFVVYTNSTTLNRFKPRLQPRPNPQPAYLPAHPVVHDSHTHGSSLSARLRLCLATAATGLFRSPPSTPQVCVAYASLRATDCKPSKAKGKAMPTGIQNTAYNQKE